jgi:hypothetical protein
MKQFIQGNYATSKKDLDMRATWGGDDIVGAVFDCLRPQGPHFPAKF